MTNLGFLNNARVNHTTPTTANPYPIWLANLGLFVSITLFLTSLWEWFTVGVFEDPAKSTNYSFGSASMLEKGGPDYASAALYAHAMLINALAGLPSIFAFCLAMKKKTTFTTLSAYACWIGVGWLGSFM